RQIAPAVAVAIDVAELVEQRLCATDVVANVALKIRIVAFDIRRQRLRRRLGLALARDAYVLVDVVSHADRAAQRDPVGGQPANHRVLHVEVGVYDRGLDAGADADAALGELGLEVLIRSQHVPDQLVGYLQVVEIPALESEQARIRFLHDADFDPADHRNFFAAHGREQSLVRRISAVGIALVTKARIRFQRDALPATPLFQPGRPRA